MNTKYKILYDFSEFQNRIMECITSEEIDRIFNNTVFATNPENLSCKQAMIHGMVMAAMMIVKCTPVYIREDPISYNNMDKVAELLGVDMYEEFLEWLKKEAVIE